jgi:hypothetical protein
VKLIAMGATGARFQALVLGAIEAAVLTPSSTVMVRWPISLRFSG